MLDFTDCPHYNGKADKLTDLFRAIRSCRVVGRARTIGNRVGVKSSSRVRISPTPPKKQATLSGWFVFLLWRDSNQNRTCQWHVHHPVLKLDDSSILFSDLTRGKQNAGESLQLRRKEAHFFPVFDCPLQCFPVSRKGKQNARESLQLRQTKTQPKGWVFCFPLERFESLSKTPGTCSSSGAHTGRYCVAAEQTIACKIA